MKVFLVLVIVFNVHLSIKHAVSIQWHWDLCYGWFLLVLVSIIINHRNTMSHTNAIRYCLHRKHTLYSITCGKQDQSGSMVCSFTVWQTSCVIDSRWTWVQAFSSYHTLLLHQHLPKRSNLLLDFFFGISANKNESSQLTTISSIKHTLKNLSGLEWFSLTGW